MDGHHPADTPARVSGEQMRQHNLALLARTVMLSGTALSRADLATASGLNRSTVTRLTDHLISHGIVVERGLRTGGSGRPSVPLFPAPHTHVALGAEIGPDNSSVALMDLTGQVLAQRYQDTPSDADPGDILRLLGESCADLARQARAGSMNLVGTRIGIPGLIHPDGGLLLTAPNLGWRNVDLRESLAAGWADCDVPVAFDNSATAAAFAEWVTRRRAGTSPHEFIYVTGSTGIGAAAVRDDSLDTGIHGWSGELGHVWVGDSVEPCSCGAHGCLETFAGRGALMRAAGFSPRAPWGHLLAAVHRRAPRATAAVRTAGTHLGRALASYVNIADNAQIVIGGLLGQVYPAMAEAVRVELELRVIQAPWSPVVVQRGAAGDDAVATGCGWQALFGYLDTVASWTRPSDAALAYVGVADTPEVDLSPELGL